MIQLNHRLLARLTPSFDGVGLWVARGVDASEGPLVRVFAPNLVDRLVLDAARCVASELAEKVQRRPHTKALRTSTPFF